LRVPAAAGDSRYVRDRRSAGKSAYATKAVKIEQKIERVA